MATFWPQDAGSVFYTTCTHVLESKSKHIMGVVIKELHQHRPQIACLVSKAILYICDSLT